MVHSTCNDDYHDHKIMVNLKSLIKERKNKERVKEERGLYKQIDGELPLTHWNSFEMLAYFLKLKKKRGLRLTEVIDNRSRMIAMGAINRTKFDGMQWVEFTNFLETETEGLSTIWYAIKKIPDFKKLRPDLFEEQND